MFLGPITDLFTPDSLKNYGSPFKMYLLDGEHDGDFPAVTSTPRLLPDLNP